MQILIKQLGWGQSGSCFYVAILSTSRYHYYMIEALCLDFNVLKHGDFNYYLFVS